MTEQCNELKNIKYKSMLLSGNSNNTMNAPRNTKNSSLKNLDAFLEAEKARNKKESWSRLDKTVKLRKLYEWGENHCKEKKWSETNGKQLKIFLKHCLDKKRLNRVKDVTYDKNGNASAFAYLDYVEMQAKCELKYNGGQLVFSEPFTVGIGNVTKSGLALLSTIAITGILSLFAHIIALSISEI